MSKARCKNKWSLPPGMTALVVAVLLVLMAARAGAQTPRRITLDGKDGAPDLTPPTGNYIHAVPTPQLELFPAPSPLPHGTVLILPGGGYTSLAFNYEGENVAKMLNAAGWDAAVLFYRLGPGEDARSRALEDARTAFTLLQTHGGDLELHTGKLGVIGFSAGGHLAARLASETSRVHPPAFLVLGYPAYLEKDGQLLPDVAPANVPTFVCVGDQDKTFFPSAEAYVAACKTHGIPCESFVAHGAGHGFGITDTLPEGARDWPEKLRAFLDTVAK